MSLSLWCWESTVNIERVIFRLTLVPIMAYLSPGRKAEHRAYLEFIVQTHCCVDLEYVNTITWNSVTKDACIHVPVPYLDLLSRGRENSWIIWAQTQCPEWGRQSKKERRKKHAHNPFEYEPHTRNDYSYCINAYLTSVLWPGVAMTYIWFAESASMLYSSKELFCWVSKTWGKKLGLFRFFPIFLFCLFYHESSFCSHNKVYWSASITK